MKELFTAKSAYDRIAEDPIFSQALKLYARHLLENGFEKRGDLKPELTASLLESGICVMEKGLFQIKNHAALAIALYKEYLTDNSINNGETLSGYLECYSKIVEVIKPLSGSRGFEELRSWVLAVAILHSARAGHISFISYLDALEKQYSESKKNRSDILEFANAFGRVLPELGVMPTKLLFDNIVKLLELTETKADISTLQHLLLSGIRRMASEDTEAALNLFYYSCNTGGPMAMRVVSTLTAGLYDLNGKTFYTTVMQPLLGDNEVAEAILVGLSIVTHPAYAEAVLFFAVYDEQKDNAVYARALVRMLYALLRNGTHYEESEWVKNECFLRMERVISEKDAVTAKTILNDLAFVEGHTDWKTRLLLMTIAQSYFTVKEFMSLIVQVYWYLHDVGSLNVVLTAIADKEPFTDIGQHLESILDEFDKKELDAVVIDLVTSNRAGRRALGNSLFGANRLRKKYLFDMDILSLPPLTQYKLWVGLCQNIGQPEHYLAALLPLLNSSSETVRESFTLKLEELAEDYAGHITEILEENLHMHNRPDIIERIKRYIEIYYSTNADLKRNVAELDPRATQSNMIKIFDKLHGRTFSRSIDRGAKKNSLLSLLGKTLMMGKGGGWKDSDGEIKKMGHIRTGMVLPRSFFIYPNEYNIMCGVEQRIDRNEEDFDLIVNLIANE
ncbi:MAG TPA: hypothetical protein VEA37_09620 [Flavobacterium sp.]|nr:hypothetical protein [Flavobacterium sp.]